MEGESAATVLIHMAAIVRRRLSLPPILDVAVHVTPLVALMRLTYILAPAQSEQMSPLWGGISELTEIPQIIAEHAGPSVSQC